jgi:Ca2+-binding EF-hand superfamily protein
MASIQTISLFKDLVTLEKDIETLIYRIEDRYGTPITSPGSPLAITMHAFLGYLEVNKGSFTNKEESFHVLGEDSKGKICYSETIYASKK